MTASDPQTPPPAPPLDDLSTQYVTLAFGLAAHIDGAIDGYYGPQELRPSPEAPKPSPEDLIRKASGLLAAVEAADITANRLDYLTAQVRGMATMAAPGKPVSSMNCWTAVRSASVVGQSTDVSEAVKGILLLYGVDQRDVAAACPASSVRRASVMASAGCVPATP